MNAPDILEYIRAAFADKPTTLMDLDPVLHQARHTYGGETVYIRSIPAPPRQQVTRRTLQRRQASKTRVV